jgi:hypothetical protein
MSTLVAITRAPSRAIASTEARPIPCPAALLKAVLPVSRPMSVPCVPSQTGRQAGPIGSKLL